MRLVRHSFGYLLLIQISLLYISPDSYAADDPNESDDALELINEYLELARKLERLRTESRDKLRRAHQALDDGDYQLAVDLAKRAHELKLPLEESQQRADSLVAQLIKTASPELGSSKFLVRENATNRLKVLGESAIGTLIEKIKTEKDVEVRSRLARIVKEYGLRIDDHGRIRQWAKIASSSTQYSDTGWSAMQATGAPNTSAAGDSPSAWASKEQNAGEEWLRLEYEIPVDLSQIRIHETFNPGGVIAVDVVLSTGERRNIWKGNEPAAEQIRWLEIEADSVRTNEIIIVLDTTKISGWQEIDAVELIGAIPD